ncbi:hypothetical protein [Aquidulcibacter sp.]|uniref:hypothetical protein n=1 Tax=Aquidulcibacter sp. TaxID=2052990 RepID=UPI0025B7AC38|nr:hypothetical protein [Aquidulcibacter sp.]MCA3696496.1 hypothetical protein [Aquidulcibacter sp.]
MSDEGKRNKPMPLINSDGANLELVNMKLIARGDGIHSNGGKLKVKNTTIIAGGDGIVRREDPE